MFKILNKYQKYLASKLLFITKNNTTATTTSIQIAIADITHSPKYSKINRKTAAAKLVFYK